jgi:hypothetical protein
MNNEFNLGGPGSRALNLPNLHSALPVVTQVCNPILGKPYGTQNKSKDKEIISNEGNLAWINILIFQIIVGH